MVRSWPRKDPAARADSPACARARCDPAGRADRAARRSGVSRCCAARSSSFKLSRRARFAPRSDRSAWCRPRAIGIRRFCGSSMCDPSSIFTSAGVTRSQSRIACKRERRDYFAAIEKEQRHANAATSTSSGRLTKPGVEIRRKSSVGLASDRRKTPADRRAGRSPAESRESRPPAHRDRVCASSSRRARASARASPGRGRPAPGLCRARASCRMFSNATTPG